MLQRPLHPGLMGISVSKKTNWDVPLFVKVPPQLLLCTELHANSKLLLIMLMNQVGFRPVSITAIDRCLGIHRSTRIRCMSELKEYGFISGDDTHVVLMDPIPVLARLKVKRDRVEKEIREAMTFDEYFEQLAATEDKVVSQRRDFLQEATDAWNRYRPKDYKKIRRISAPLAKAVDCHMRELGVAAHSYEEFFSILKAGVEKSKFWSSDNNSKTLQSITGIGSPTDRKKGNVYALFNDGVDAPAEASDETQREDTTVFPASYRKPIDEYEAAQHSYYEAYRSGGVTKANEDYVVRTEQALVDIGLDPARFRYKFGLKTWPTNTPEPEESRVVNWTYEDEYGQAY